MTDALPAAAWFPDPHDATRLRWWDGATWTDHVHPPVEPATPAHAPAPVAAATEADVVEDQPEEVREYWGFRVTDESRPFPEGEQLLEIYYGDEDEPGDLNFRFGSEPHADHRHRFRATEHGMAMITEIPDAGDRVPRDETAERARLAEAGLTPEQIESSIAAVAKISGMLQKAEGNKFARKAAHFALRKLAFNTAQGGRGDAMDITFAGRRYRAHGARRR